LVVASYGHAFYLPHSCTYAYQHVSICFAFKKKIILQACTTCYLLYSFVKIAIVQVKGAQLWGTDIYTNDSDLVAGRFLEIVSESFPMYYCSKFLKGAQLLMRVSFSANAYWLLLPYVPPSTICHPRASCNCSSSTTTRE